MSPEPRQIAASTVDMDEEQVDWNSDDADYWWDQSSEASEGASEAVDASSDEGTNSDAEDAARPRPVIDLQDLLQRRTRISSTEPTDALVQPYRRTAENEIRLFELAPGIHQESLRGRLLYVDLDFEDDHAPQSLEASNIDGPKPTYTAVSYCWGPSKMEWKLQLGEHTIGITETVDTMLRTFRHCTDYVRLWIDQICINQQDVLDKQDQVKLMSAIYSKARNTIIWLGHGLGGVAFNVLEVLGNLARRHHDQNEEFDHFHGRLGPLRKIVKKTGTAQPISDLFAQAWFSRTWVIQEVVISKAPFIMYGDTLMSWQDFSSYCTTLGPFDIFAELKSAEEQSDPTWKIVMDIASARKDFAASKEGVALFDLLKATRYAAVTMPVDKIYGIMALCSAKLTIDYSKSVKTLFTETTLQLLDKVHISELLSCIDHDTSKSELPSWVADWSCKRRCVALSDSVNCRLYYAAGGRQEENSIDILAAQRTLSTPALLVDTIKHMTDIVQEAELGNVDSKSSNMSLRQILKFARKHISHQVLGFNAFCATLVAGRGGLGLSAWPQEYIEIMSLLCDFVASDQSAKIFGQTYLARWKGRQLKLEHLNRRKPRDVFQNLKLAYRNALLHRRLAWTTSGRLALIPRFACIGDQLFIIPSCPVPYVLRRRSDNSFMFVGECYLHEVMDSKWMYARGDDLDEIHIV